MRVTCDGCGSEIEATNAGLVNGKLEVSVKKCDDCFDPDSELADLAEKLDEMQKFLEKELPKFKR